jgi:hypothetical protein
MPLTKKTDTVTAGIRRAINQYRDKPVFEAMLTAYLQQLQEVEDVLFQLENRIPASGDAGITGVQLDVLGALVGQPRGGRDDTEYLKWIMARTLVNHASGLGDEIFSLLTTILPDDTNFTYSEGTAEFDIYIDDVVSDSEDLARIIRETRGAGIGFNLSYFVDVDSFQFSDTDATVSDPDKGFGDDTISTVGGVFASASDGD